VICLERLIALMGQLFEQQKVCMLVLVLITNGTYHLP
jgi:hypothetical protein